mmetsp:Transcript_18758/g.47322  ORF Transcript_18758/g.47322 Transcript_18758/m.47322 type:complete len:196 (+) Transcript_18758:172-759(+)
MGTEACDAFVSAIKQQGVKAVVFDFDCTTTITHSGGRVRHEKLGDFLSNNISPCFQQLLPKLFESRIKVGVATFADSYKCPNTHLGGEDLVRRFFGHYFSDTMEDKVQIVAAYPENYQNEAAYLAKDLNAPMPQSKEYHLGLLCDGWGLHSREVMLVDDDIKNVGAAVKDGHPTRFVKDRKGLMPDNLLEQFPPK